MMKNVILSDIKNLTIATSPLISMGVGNIIFSKLVDFQENQNMIVEYGFQFFNCIESAPLLTVVLSLMLGVTLVDINDLREDGKVLKK